MFGRSLGRVCEIFNKPRAVGLVMTNWGKKCTKIALVFCKLKKRKKLKKLQKGYCNLSRSVL